MDILFEDNHLLAVNKAVSEIVQGDKTGDQPLSEKAKLYLKEKYNKPGNVFLGVTHRLDRPTSGAVLFARTSKALSRLNEMFRQQEVRKTYWAVVDALPPNPAGRLENYLKKNAKQNKSYVVGKNKGGAKLAVLNYRTIATLQRYFLLEIELETGRHHQIRAQLAHLGCHIKGDLKYGAKRSNPGGGIHLHARLISFLHPVQKQNIEIVAAPPQDTLWEEFLKAID